MESNKRPSQADEVLSFMEQNGSITHRQAEDFLGCMRLASRIHELKRRENAVSIKTEFVPVKARNGRVTHIARYSLC